MTDLAMPNGSLAGIVAFWPTIHIPDSAMDGVIAEFQRVLRPDGRVLVGFHAGEGTEHTSVGYSGKPISVDMHLRTVATMSGWLRSAGCQVESESIFRPDGAAPGAIVVARTRP